MVDYFFSAKKFNSSNGRVHSQTNFKLALLLFVLLWLLCGDCGSTTQLSSRYTDWELEFYRTIDWVVRHEGAGKVVKKKTLEAKIIYRTRAIITPSWLLTNRSWTLTIHKDRILWKKLLGNKEMVFKIGVKNLTAAGYNGAHMVYWIIKLKFIYSE